MGKPQFYAEYLARRRARRRDWVLQVLRRHPNEAFTAFEIAGMAHIGSGSIYPIMYALEREGIVVAQWEEPRGDHQDRRRRLYHLA